MKYAALVYYQERLIHAMNEQEWHDLNQECLAGVERLTDQGHFLAGQALQPVENAASVRVRDGEVLVSDGPFAETKEQLAGFYLLEARVRIPGHRDRPFRSIVTDHSGPT